MGSLPLLLVVVLVFGVTVWLALALTSQAPSPAVRMATYGAAEGRRQSPGMTVHTSGVSQRLFAPLLTRVLALAASTAPPRIRNAAAAELQMAGSTMRPTVFLGIRGILQFGLPILGGLYMISVPSPQSQDWLVLLLSVVWGRRMPSFWLKRKIRKRQRAIDRALPYALDLMVACLEGGLSLDASLAKVSEQSEGPLSLEIQRTLVELTLGRPPSDAMRDLGLRSAAPDLKRLTENVVQAERMGISITDTLRQLAVDSRIRRRQLAEEMGRKAPIKMVPVLIFCVLPALGIVVMTPAAILLTRTLAQATPP